MVLILNSFLDHSDLCVRQEFQNCFGDISLPIDTLIDAAFCTTKPNPFLLLKTLMLPRICLTLFSTTLFHSLHPLKRELPCIALPAQVPFPFVFGERGRHSVITEELTKAWSGGPLEGGPDLGFELTSMVFPLVNRTCELKMEDKPMKILSINL